MQEAPKLVNKFSVRSDISIVLYKYDFANLYVKPPGWAETHHWF